MPKHIQKFLTPQQMRFPLAGLLLILGIFAVDRAKPVVSNQIDFMRAATTNNAGEQVKTYTWIERNSADEKAERLRSALGSEATQNTFKQVRLRKAIAKSVPNVELQRVATNQVQAYTWLQRNSLDSTATNTLITQNQVSARQATPAAKFNFPSRNGVYLYGQTQKPGQFGRDYIIFEKQQNNIIGALYSPSSELNCFKGTLNSSGQLAMNVAGFAGDVSPIRVATKNTLPVVNNIDQPVDYTHAVRLQEYNQINSIPANDRNVLQQCKQVPNN
ncbi:hypothetical protein [Iningainema tapete]|uniref:Uncharacterized protein n=1 Tax=Iningainema tapete BLCC-T55 TaxID=2748662 RepID=A0A8J6XR15_9CYAN|nr:hypothetical protein [Iningainema tapete]MBD2776719.1 hypothetical protein [Iningainema tapete BLCC-T55]